MGAQNMMGAPCSAPSYTVAVRGRLSLAPQLPLTAAATRRGAGNSRGSREPRATAGTWGAQQSQGFSTCNSLHWATFGAATSHPRPGSGGAQGTAGSSGIVPGLCAVVAARLVAARSSQAALSARGFGSAQDQGFRAFRARTARRCAVTDTTDTAGGGGGGSGGSEEAEAAEAQVKAEADLAWKVDLVRSVGEECQTESELRRLIEKKPGFLLYDGFEPSGRMHIAQGIYKTINVNKCTRAGGKFIFWVADWFALMNDKMGGDMDKIQTVGKYLMEVWKASGMDMSRVEFLWSSDEISKNAGEYWGHVMDIAGSTTLARVKKCCQIMGRNEDSLTAAQILYPLMQCADIFFLKADICQLGVDQRKVNMLAREYCESIGRKLKPVILSHHMLYGLKKGQAKMSKSDPDSAIFMEDSPEDVQRKIQAAYCPQAPEAHAVQEEGMQLLEDALKNPCLDYARYVLFSREAYRLQIGENEFSSFEELQEAFLQGSVSEAALKKSLTTEINTLLEPVRQHFTRNEEAAALLEQVKQWRRDTLVPTSSLTRLQPSLPDGPRFVVFAPLPSEQVALSDVLQLLKCLGRAPEDSLPVLWLQDWSARTLGKVGGTAACLDAYYQILLHSLQTLDPALMERVVVLRQGEAILSGPADYWTSVINAGRKCSLESIRNAQSNGEDMNSASQVVASIMHIGDVLSVCAGEATTTICCTETEDKLHRLAMGYLSDCKLPTPELQVVEMPSLRLKNEGEGVEADVNLYITDMKPDINRKVKKAFCEPENVSFCPPLSLVSSVVLPLSGEFAISRKPENGGDKTYSNSDALTEDFAAGVLHPGDLKPAVGLALNSVLERVRPGLKTSALKAAQKKLLTYTAKLKKQKAR